MSENKTVEGSIPLDDYETLRYFAEKEGKSIPEIISESIKLWLRYKQNKKDDSLFQTKGLFDGSEDMSQNHDDIY